LTKFKTLLNGSQVYLTH